MMEVKQNTAVDLNDLLTSSKNSGTDEVDDAVMSDLTDGTTHDLVNCDLIKSNVIENGDVAMSSLIDDVDVGADLNATVNSELEDALLAEEDVLPKISNTKIVEPTTTATEDDILADKVETSNSTTSSNNVRDPGDDLDTLLSKINDIVEDCIDSECGSIEQVISKITDKPKTENNLNESVIFVHESTKKNEKESNLLEKEILEIQQKSAINNVDDALKQNEIGENILADKIPISSIESPVAEALKNSGVDEAKEETNKCIQDEIDACVAEATAEEEKLNTSEKSVDNTLENNKNLDKTEKESMEANIVQDNEITSNSIEVIEAEKTQPSTNEDVDKAPSPKVVDTNEIKEATQTNNNEAVTPSQDDEKSPTKDVKTSENVENEDSDDEIVFYVDKPPEIEKSNKTETTSIETETKSETTKSGNSTVQKETNSTVNKPIDDDDVVLLLDDEEDDVSQVKKVKESNTEISSKNEAEEKRSEEVKACSDASVQPETKDIDLDNSDNARDDFVSENLNENEKSLKKPAVAETPEETNSNCSSSSNLLQEAESIKNASDEQPTPEEVENEEDEDDGDVELIESEQKESESSEKLEDSELSPPAKRIRLSVDSERSTKAEGSCNEIKDVEGTKASEKQQESKDINEDETKSDAISTLKRTHDVIEVEADEKSVDSKVSGEGVNKKPKTDDLKTDDTESSEKVVEIKDDKPNEDTQSEVDDKKDIKAVPSYQPIPLYPAPKFEVLKSESTISLDFLKKFRKSFDNMTKQDLEELVLQKVVEAIIHRSEFSEMRELIEKQEKLITAHRSKISELSKQFRDLEMVHNRVVKDIEQRNSQFIMPVKITRAVGLQVYIPNKKTIPETASSSTAPNVPSSPQRPISSQASSTSSTSLTPPQRQFIASQTETQQQRPGSTGPTGPVTTGNVRRGCVQKITPIRPVPGVNQPPSAGPTSSAAAYRNTPNHSAATQPRILNKNAAPPPNPTSIQRSRFLSSNQDGQRMPQQQQLSRTTSMPATSGQRVAPTAVAQPKPSSTVATAVQRRSEPLPPAAAASSTSSIVDNYINTLTHLTGGNTAVSITPAKPKEKAVIDLTDEDEAPGQTSSSQPATQMPLSQVQRRSLPAQNTANSQYGRAAPPLARIPPNSNQMVNNKNRQMQAQKNNSFASISTPPGTSITRINVPQNATNVQRVKYSHPAPLPATPPQAFNPSWKLPPPRPTIRISNLDNGIVISWTMEESMDRHAECVSYQIYAYQETSGPPMVDSWRHVGDVKAMLLPMAVTLTQFQEGQRYYFAVRAVDCHQRFGPFSLPKTWS